MLSGRSHVALQSCTLSFFLPNYCPIIEGKQKLENGTKSFKKSMTPEPDVSHLVQSK